MKSFVRYTAVALSILLLSGAAFAWFDVLTHEAILANPKLKTAAGWLVTGLMLLALGMRARRGQKSAAGPPSNSSAPLRQK